jgi:serine phosphatase RsbU (regulator of sigma subunit)
VSIPAGEEGGDLLELLPCGLAGTALYVADVVGKGASASSLGRNVRRAFREVASSGCDPAAACRLVNGKLYDDFAADQFATGFYALINRRRRTMRFTRAGHTPALLMRRDGTVLRLMEGGGLLGACRGSRYGQGVVELRDGDRLVVYSDGLSEATDSQGREFGERHLLETLARHRGLGASGLERALLRAVDRFSGGMIRDDVTLGVLAVRPDLEIAC